MAPPARNTSKNSTKNVAADPDGWLAEFTRSLTSATRAVHSMRLYTEMARLAGSSIRPSLFIVLTRIGEMQPVRVSDVADHTEYDRSTVSRQVAELVQLGCVERVRDETDGRAVVLKLTEHGSESIVNVFGAWQSFLGEIMDDWTEADKKKFLVLLRRLSAAVNEHLD